MFRLKPVEFKSVATEGKITVVNIMLFQFQVTLQEIDMHP